jgi:hypothetical protein
MAFLFIGSQMDHYCHQLITIAAIFVIGVNGTIGSIVIFGSPWTTTFTNGSPLVSKVLMVSMAQKVAIGTIGFGAFVVDSDRHIAI